MNKQYKFISVDLQNDFADKDGVYSASGPSVLFLKETVFPFLKEQNIKINEIISDYRQPRPGDRGDCCRPGEWGYKSIVPKEIVNSTWVKCMNSPVWIRDNIGNPDKEPGLPYSDPDKFGKWLKENIGNPESVVPVVFGLTIDCCVLSTLQELSWRGYYPLVLKEGVAHSSGEKEDTENILESPIPNWAEVISWEDLKDKFNKSLRRFNSKR
jgi:nicotinamidase-related amidase|tara:strand:+ start:230 stop:865 length:636 start_codon:yes stop_codon:yes gene_type:complete